MKKYCILLLLAFVSIANFAQNSNMTLRSTYNYFGKTCANIGGYWQNGKEYALVCTSGGTSIVDVTNPDSIFEVTFVIGPTSLWREIKTYQQYAFVTTEASNAGLQIIDLSNLPNSNLSSKFVFTTSPQANCSLGAKHSLHIDVPSGFAYLFGGSCASGAFILDLKPDPYNPTYAGIYQNPNQIPYIHDGFAINDTLYAAHINQGNVTIVDMTNKSTPQVLAAFTTPTSFTHNCWRSDDGKYLFTTDENSFSPFLTAYDVSNPTNVKEIDRHQSNPGSGSVVHNTHYYNGYLVNAYYKDGVTIVDAHRPFNLVQVGNYDTYPQQSGGGYNGCWGAYPYLPSGNILATNIPIPFVSYPSNDTGKLFVFTPTYKRACYAEGVVLDSITNQPLQNVNVQFSGITNGADLSDILGDYYIGVKDSGAYTITASKAGYITRTFNNVIVNHGQVFNLNFKMLPTSVGLIEYSIINDIKYQFDQQQLTLFNKRQLPYQFEIFEVSGKRLGGGQVQNEETLIVNHRFDQGIYLLRLKDNDGNIKTIKLIQ
jgi:choice-of-anchor B domain-containing protein